MKRYPGGKNAAGTWQWAVERMPTHTYYAEPFVGSGGLLRRKVPALETVVCDRDAAVVDYWKRLQFPGVRAYRRCGIRWLETFAALRGPEAGEWLVYLDPPYLHSTRVRLDLYRYELSEADHRRLLRAVLKLKCRVMISGYASPLYAEALAGWTLHTRPVMTRGHSWRVEHLWCNFSADDVADFAAHTPGRDRRERERIKKRLRRWGQKFAAMPDYERRAVLAELVRTESRKGL